MQQQEKISLSLFYSYADVEEDELLQQKLVTHLSTLRRQQVISEWYKRKIVPGEKRKEQIKRYLETASIILLLISPDFLASNDCYEIEMTRALERHERNEARVIPILLRPVHWQGTPFADLAFLPANGVPVTQWSDQDPAFLEIEQGIRQVVDDINAAKDSQTQGPSASSLPIPPPASNTSSEDINAAKDSQTQGSSASSTMVHPQPPSPSVQTSVSNTSSEGIDVAKKLPTSEPPTPSPLKEPQSPASNHPSRRCFLQYGLVGGTGIVIGAAASFGGITLLKKRLTDVRMIIIPSSFAGSLTGDVLSIFRDALRNAFGLPVTLEVGKTYQECIDRFGSGEFNVFWAAEYSYVKTKVKYDAFPLLAIRHVTPDDPMYYGYILTKASSNISTLAGLKEKTLSYVDPSSTSGYLLQRYGMYKEEIDHNGVNWNYTRSHNASLESIFNKQADACAVGSEFYKSTDGSYKSRVYTALLQKYSVDDTSIRQIYRSEPVFAPPIVVHPDMSDEDKLRLQSGFGLLDDKILLSALDIKGFGIVTDTKYDNIRNMAHALNIDLKA